MAGSDQRSRRLIASLVFAAITFALLAYAGAVLKPGRSGVIDGAAWRSFEALEPNSVDVVFYGSSHAFSGIDPAVIWRERGIPTFVHGGPAQMLQVTEYYVRETLRTQKPRIIALEMTSASYSPRTFSPEFHTTNVGAMPWSENKLAASWLATPAYLRVNILVDVWVYHARWAEVTRADFDLANKAAETAYLKGFVPAVTAEEVTSEPYVRPADDYPISDAALAYNADALERIARVCADNDIVLLLFLTPTGPPESYTYFLDESARALAADFGNVYVLDLSTPGAVPEISYTTDFRDSGHLNWRGAEKTSRVMADYLADTFGLADRRQDAAYLSWNTDTEAHDAHIEELERAAALP